MEYVAVGLSAACLALLAYMALTNRRRIGREAELSERLNEVRAELIERIGDQNLPLLLERLGRIDGLTEASRAALERVSETLGDKLGGFQREAFDRFEATGASVRRSLAEGREEQGASVERFKREMGESLRQSSLALEARLAALQAGNERKLDEMRGVVETKLVEALNRQLNASFKSVQEHLESVQKGLGEMQGLASDVGDLRKVISNVKTRGVFGEIQLERILEQMLAPDHYETNYQAKPNSRERVEFAIRLPGKGEGEEPVYLPIDSKFPSEDYEALLSAYEGGERERIDAARGVFAAKIRAFAKEIGGKYINPPRTSDFAILFLPFESLYAEVAQTAGLFEELQSRYKIAVTGPATLSAFLNALQMGFKTLRIERRSAEVWTVLGAVKTEFERFAGALQKVQNSLQTADSQLTDLVGTRTRAMARQLRGVAGLPDAEARALLPVDSDAADPDDA